MTEKTEEQIAKEKAAVLAMKNAQSNMGAALTRIEDLERSLRSVSTTIGVLAEFISPNVYIYGSNSTPCRSVAKDAQAAIAKALG